MKIHFLILVIALFSCKTNKTINEVQVTEYESISTNNPWTKIDIKLNDNLVLPTKYSTYRLNSNLFDQQLKIGMAQLPFLNSEMHIYEVENSNTMSIELQKKFPNIKSYKGFDTKNSLCTCRIDQLDLNFKITILCNDATFYVTDLFDDEIYFFYNKKDLPEGVGQINE